MYRVEGCLRPATGGEICTVAFISKRHSFALHLSHLLTLGWRDDNLLMGGREIGVSDF